MEFSLALTPYRRFPDHRQLLRTVGLAERLGFWSVNFGDHVAVSPQRDDAKAVSTLYYDPLVLASAVLARFERIRVVFNVLVLPYHHPVRLAKALATLDVLSEGRITVGMGIGWLRSEFEAMGAPFGRRGAMTEEYIAAMQALWRDRPATFEGRYVSFEGVVNEPRPFRGTQPDLWVGAGRSTKGIERAARVGADGISFMTRPSAAMERHLELARTLLDQRGRDVTHFPFAYSLDYAQPNELMVAHYLTDNSVPHDVLSAEPAHAAEQIAHYQQLGFTHLFLRFSAQGYEQFEECVTQFGEEVLRPLRASSAKR